MLEFTRRVGRPQFSLATMLAVVLVGGLFLFGFRHATPGTINCMVSLTAMLLALACAGALYAAKPARPKWGAFAVFGWVYFLVAFGPGFKDSVGDGLATTAVLDYANENYSTLTEDVATELAYRENPNYDRWGPATSPLGSGLIYRESKNGEAIFASDGFPDNTQTYSENEYFFRIKRHDFLLLGHSFFALVFGLFGSLLVQLLFPAPEKNEAEAPKNGKPQPDAAA